MRFSRWLNKSDQTKHLSSSLASIKKIIFKFNSFVVYIKLDGFFKNDVSIWFVYHIFLFFKYILNFFKFTIIIFNRYFLYVIKEKK